MLTENMLLSTCLTVSSVPEASSEDNTLFIIRNTVDLGYIQIKRIAQDWPIGDLLDFLADDEIREMCDSVPRSFPINYFWLEMLYIEPWYRGNNYGIQALNLILDRLPPYSVLAAQPHKTADWEVSKIIDFYKHHNFHLLLNTQGNDGDPILFTFVQNR